MGETVARPIIETYRIAILRAAFLLLLPLIFMVQTYWEDTIFGELMEQGGLLLIIAGVLGRFWSILYIGGHKNRTVMQSGPYSICRHPLYLFSTIATLGFALMLQSVILAVVIAVVVFSILNLTASKEEVFLRATFGGDYDAYAAKTPRIIPDISLFKTDPDVSFSVAHLRGNFFDALVFIALIPLAEVVEVVRESGVLPVVVLP